MNPIHVVADACLLGLKCMLTLLNSDGYESLMGPCQNIPLASDAIPWQGLVSHCWAPALVTVWQLPELQQSRDSLNNDQSSLVIRSNIYH